MCEFSYLLTYTALLTVTFCVNCQLDDKVQSANLFVNVMKLLVVLFCQLVIVFVNSNFVAHLFCLFA